MCCGNKVTSLPQKNAQSAPRVAGAPATAQTFAGKDGFITIDYVGGNMGKATFYGPVTHTRYVAGGVKPRILIDVRDARTGMRDAPGLLELTTNNKPTFKEAAL